MSSLSRVDEPARERLIRVHAHIVFCQFRGLRHAILALDRLYAHVRELDFSRLRVLVLRDLTLLRLDDVERHRRDEDVFHVIVAKTSWELFHRQRARRLAATTGNGGHSVCAYELFILANCDRYATFNENVSISW